MTKHKKTDALRVQKRFPSYNMSPQNTYAKGILFLAVMAAAGMAYLIFMHWMDPQWFFFFVLEGSFCYIAIPGIIWLDYYARVRGLSGISGAWNYKHTLAHWFIISLVVLVIQKLITQLGAVISVNQTELFFYYIFGAISEELFYRGFLFRGILGNKNSIARLVLGTIISTGLFIPIHVSYWNDPLKLTIVTASGVLLCLFYWAWKDLLANVAGHATINFIVAITLVALPASDVTPALVVILFAILALIVLSIIQIYVRKKTGEIDE